MGKSKGLFLLAMGMLALLAGLYLSGYLALLLLKQHLPLSWQTYWGYFKAPDLSQWAPYATQIKLGGAVGFGAPLPGYLGLLVLTLKPKAECMHGETRFARRGYLASKDMFKPPPTGIVVGKFDGKLVRLAGQQFVILAVPTRSGRGLGVLIPNLLDWDCMPMCRTSATTPYKKLRS